MDEYGTTDGTRRFCPQCGKPVNPTARFCGNCGATLRPVTAPDVPAEDDRPSSEVDDTTLLGAETTVRIDEVEGTGPEADGDEGTPGATEATPGTAESELTDAPDAGDDVDRTILRPSPIPESPSVGAAAQAAAPEGPTMPDPGEPAPANRSRIPVVGIVIAAVCAAVVIGILGWWFFGADRGPEVASVPIVINAEGYSDECTAIPLQVEGTDAEGDAVSEAAFVDATGGGLDLAAGDYTVSFPASPLTPSGVLYVVPDVTLTIVIAPADDGSLQVSGNDQEVTFTPSTALDQTDEMIQTAYDWATKDPDQRAKADELHDKAVQVHQEAVQKDEADRKAAEEAQRKAEEEQRAAEEAQRQAEEEARNQALNPIQGWWSVGAPMRDASTAIEGYVTVSSGGYLFDGDQAYEFSSEYKQGDDNVRYDYANTGPTPLGSISAEPCTGGPGNGYAYTFGGTTLYWFQSDPNHLFTNPDGVQRRSTFFRMDSAPEGF